MNYKIKELKENYNPFEVYKLFKDEIDSIFLDSSKEDKILSRYSFIGINPISKFQVKDKEIYIDDKKIQEKEPFKVLDNLIKKYHIDIQNEIPFIGGAIGYFSYDITNNKKSSIPKSIFVFYENLIIFDLLNKKTYISALGVKTEPNNSIKLVQEKLKNYKNHKEIKFEISKNEVFSNFSEEEYKKAVNIIKEYIRCGDVYIANMTRKVWCDNKEDSFYIYEKLRSINKAPFSAFLNFNDFQIISSSPERFLSIRNGLVQTRPIKGTRPRGKTKEEDNKNRNALLNSEKDKSELLMIVDLERNDLSKVCLPHSVKVKELFKIEEYATVFHLVATIEGKLQEKVSAVECIKECFPGGSITGAPKKRAMEIIDELEGINRGIYTGAIGYFDLRGNCDFNIVIRSIIKKDDKAFFGVGGGITYESNTEEEWLETNYKANALTKVL